MPVYDYVCDTCGARVEKLILEENPAVYCPRKCTVPMRRLFGTFAIRASARIPKNHIPKSQGGDFDGKSAYWQGTESRYR